MKNPRVGELNEAINGLFSDETRWPVAKLRAVFTVDDVREWWTTQSVEWATHPICYALQPWAEVMDVRTKEFELHRVWCLAFCEWIVRDCGFPLDDTSSHEQISKPWVLFDYVLNSLLHGQIATPIFHMLRAYGSKPSETWNFWLTELCEDYTPVYHILGDGPRFWDDFTPIMQTLLDTGATLENCTGAFQDRLVSTIHTWHTNRLFTRTACLVILGCGKRGRWRDVARLIAAMVWKERFDNAAVLH